MQYKHLMQQYSALIVNTILMIHSFRKHPVNGELVCPNHFDQAGYANPVQHPPGPINHWWTERDDDEKVSCCSSVDF